MTQQTESHPGTLVPSPQATPQPPAGELTPEAAARLRLLVERAGADAAVGDEADVAGYATNLYDDPFSFQKGRLRQAPPGAGGGTGALQGAFVLAAVFLGITGPSALGDPPDP